MEKWFTENWTENTRFSLKFEKRLESVQTDFQKIEIFHSKEWGNFMTIDGLLMLTEKDEFIYHDMIVHPAMATNPGITKVLVVGGGDGGTVRELCNYDNIKQIDLVEIDEEVINLSLKYLKEVSNKFNDERVNIHIADGIDYVKKSKDKSYDLILIDSTDPIGPGESLFTKDFYTNCYRILNEEGILINQHESPYFENYREQMKMAHQKIKNIFPIAKVYQFHQSVYPSGHWLFGFASKKFDPLTNHKKDKWEKLNLKTKYYNSNIHTGCFMLPTYVNEELKKNT